MGPAGGGVYNLMCSISGTSSVARGLSGYLDALIGNPMSTFFKARMPIDVSFLADFPDFFSFAIVMLVSVLLAVGVKESSLLNNIFTVINLCTVVLVIVTGIMRGLCSIAWWRFAPC